MSAVLLPSLRLLFIATILIFPLHCPQHKEEIWGFQYYFGLNTVGQQSIFKSLKYPRFSLGDIALFIKQVKSFKYLIICFLTAKVAVQQSIMSVRLSVCLFVTKVEILILKCSEHSPSTPEAPLKHPKHP